MAAYRTSVAGGGTSGSSNRTVAITPAVGDLFVVFCNAATNTNSTPTCSDNNSGTYTRILTALHDSSTDTMSVFVRDQLLPNTTSTTITVATGSNDAAEIVVVAVSGMSKVGSAAVRSSGSQANQAGGGTPAPALNQNALTRNMTITAVAALGAAGANGTPNASWTERQDAAQSTPTTGLEVATRNSGFTGTTITYGGTTATAFASAAIELNGDLDGSLSKTLDAATLSAVGDVDLAAGLSKTLDDATLSAVGDVDIAASLSKSLDDATLSAVGDVDITASLSKSLDDATLNSTGELTTSAITGDLVITLDDAVLSAVGDVDIVASLSKSLDDAVLSAVGDVDIAASLSKSLEDATLSAVGDVDIAASLSKSLDDLACDGSGTVDLLGSSNLTLSDLACMGIGSLSLVGSLDRVLDDVMLSATGGEIESREGSADIVLDQLEIAASGDLVIPQYEPIVVMDLKKPTVVGSGNQRKVSFKIGL